MGTKLQRQHQLAKITSIHPDILSHEKNMFQFSVAGRLSWAAHRTVTREEDESYSLLGIFGVHMPLLYGEGRQKAFLRLQEAIYTSAPDQSIFLFRYRYIL